MTDEDKRLQKLIDLTFEIAFLVRDPRYELKSLSRENLADWVAKQLRASGFDTEPRGLSCGVLKD